MDQAHREALSEAGRHQLQGLIGVPLLLFRRVPPYSRYFVSQNNEHTALNVENRVEHGGTIMRERIICRESKVVLSCHHWMPGDLLHRGNGEALPHIPAERPEHSLGVRYASRCLVK